MSCGEIIKETATLKLEALARQAPSSAASAPAPSSADDAEVGPAVRAFDDMLAGPFATYLKLSNEIGGLVKDQAVFVENALKAQRQLILVASLSKKPDAKSLQEAIAPISQAIQKIVEIKDKNRPAPLFNHLSVIAEGIPALGWVAVEPTPAPFVGDMRDAAQFYCNRVMKEYKDKDKKHVDWVSSFVALLNEMQVYVKKNHTTGLSWNPKGGDLKAQMSKVSSSAPAAAPAGGPAPPPPGPPPAPPVVETTTSSNSSGQVDMGGVFNQLNVGDKITSGLKKVDKNQMTHKNPALRASSVVKASEVEKAPASAPKAAVVAKKPPKFALEGSKWAVENQENKTDIVISDTAIKQVVYIYGCNNCTIQVKGKVNSVSIDSCKKTAVVVESVVASFEAVNCKSIQLQVLQQTPTVAIDKTDGCQLYLSKDCLNAEILTAKCSEINICIPPLKEGEDFVEKAVAEQFKSKIVNGAVVTVPVEHSG